MAITVKAGKFLKLRNLNAPAFTQVIGPIAFGFLFADYNNRDRVCKFTKKRALCFPGRPFFLSF